MASTKYPVLRQTLIAFSFLALVGLFFAVNHFIFIPQQQQAYNDKVFRALRVMSEDFAKTLDGQGQYFARNINKRSSVKKEPLGDCNPDVRTKLILSFQQLNTTLNKSQHERTYRFETDTVRIFSTGNKNDTVQTPLAIRNIFEHSVQHLHKDIFELVMLVKRDTSSSPEEKKSRQIKDRLLYTHGNLAAGYLLPGDSLFNTPRFGQFSSISDISIAGTEYKVFTLPFRYAGTEMMLTGFLKEKDYKFATTNYSKPTLLWVVFLLSLFIISLPLVKVYLASRQERISTNDLRLMMIVFTAMPLIVVITAAILLIHRQVDNKTNNDLVTLHNKVQENFRNEVQLAVSQLRLYDSLLRDTSLLCRQYLTNKASLKTIADTADFKDVLFYPTRYKNLDDIYWVNKAGVQNGKWFFIHEQVSYLDVSSRNYFKKMRERNVFVSGPDSFYIEPTISWATGKYSVNVLTTSNENISTTAGANDSTQASMIGLAGSLYSVCNPVVPKGYNFCIVNERGEILFHSQTERSLHENIFDESNSNLELINAVRKKDSVLIPDLQLFDRSVKLLLTPVGDMPSFYLMSYFNKREQNIFVFHVSAFTLLCTSLTLFLLLVLILLFYVFKTRSSERRLYTYESAWMKPSKKKNTFYQQNIIQQAAIVLLSLLFLLLMIVTKENQYWYLLQASVLLPFLVVTSYMLLRNEFNAKSTHRPYVKRHAKILVIYLLAVLFIIFSLNLLQQGSVPRFRLLPVFAIILLTIAVPFIAKQTPNFQGALTRFFSSSYVVNYTALIFITSLLISVLPAMGICSFAMNEEKQMQVKAAQFDAAKNIETRRDSLNNYFKTTKLATHEGEYIQKRKLSDTTGVYLLHNRLTPTGSINETNAHLEAYSPFYQAVTRFLFLPKDHMDFYDNNASYFWSKNLEDTGGSLSLFYRNETDYQTKNSITIRSLAEESNLLLSLFNSYAGALIFLGVLAFFIFQFMLIQKVAKKIFLLDYFNSDEKGIVDQNGVNKYYQSLTLNPNDKAFLQLHNSELTNENITAIENECARNRKEEEEKVLRLLHILTPAYDAIWKELKNEEKFVLYDFALDGFTNYRNIDILYGLYQKGLIQKKDQQLELMNYSFRSYLLGKTGTEEIQTLEQQLNYTSSWKNLKITFFILFFAIMLFIFATQQDVSNRILAIVSGMATLVPLLLKIFDRNLIGGGSKQGS
jgi:hypothetical protein